MWIVVDVVINCGYDDITKKNEKSRIEYDINGRKFEFWMKKITALMTCLLGVSMFCINSNNEQWLTINKIKNIYILIDFLFDLSY